jgi:hypothetical protein
MNLKICAVRDQAVDAFGTPYFVPTTGLAIRTFTDEVNRESDDNQLYKHPKDFTLYELGDYDNNEAKITTHDQPKLLVSADQVLTK